MAASPVNKLKTLVDNMFASGLLDDQFKELQTLQDEATPDFVAEVVTFYCNDGDRILGDLTKLLEKPIVDFDEVIAFVHQLKGSSSSVGARKVENACIEVRAFCQHKNRDGCRKTLETAKTEFYELRDKFQTMLKLQRQINGFGPK